MRDWTLDSVMGGLRCAKPTTPARAGGSAREKRPPDPGGGRAAAPSGPARRGRWRVGEPGRRSARRLFRVHIVHIRQADLTSALQVLALVGFGMAQQLLGDLVGRGPDRLFD